MCNFCNGEVTRIAGAAVRIDEGKLLVKPCGHVLGIEMDIGFCPRCGDRIKNNCWHFDEKGGGWR